MDSREAVEALLQGDHLPARKLAASADAPDCWRHVAELWLALCVGDGVAPLPTEISSNAPTHCAEFYWRGHARLAWLRGDRAAMEHALGRLVSLETSWRRLAEGWIAVLEGKHFAASEKFEDTDQRVEERVITALALEESDVAAALGAARTAMRMARTESLPECEYLSAIVLARLRRRSGQSVFALRIADAVARYAPRLWQDWICAESALAGSESWDSLLEISTPPLRGLKLDQKVAHSAEMWEGDVPQELALWAQGDEALPRGVRVSADRVAACLCSADSVRRVVVARSSEDARFALVSEPRERLDTATVALAKHGRMNVTAFFSKVYGFPFDRGLHRGALNTLVHRLGARLAGVAEVDRDDSTIALSVTEPFFVSDPTVQSGPADIILRIIASESVSKAKEIARLTGIPVRTVQHHLKQLVSDGDCHKVGQGPRSTYQLEDTVFSEPTWVREGRT